jgi:hypothetical protein
MTPKADHANAIRAYDYAVAVILGMTACVVSWWVVPDGLPGAVAMLFGMLVGIVAVLPVFALVMWMLGGFEIVVMALQIGMIAGMGGPMIRGGTLSSVLMAGAGAGLVVQLLLHALDRAQHGPVQP